MGKIVAIGGGSMLESETLGIDQEVIALSGKERPKALFIPTASYDNPERWEVFREVYGNRLGCDADVLYLLGLNPTQSELEDKILSSDLIYVGGGNTLKLMRRWRRLGVDKILEKAYQQGIVLSGLSAGAICWFNHGHSDSMSFYADEGEAWKYVRVKGMGLVSALGVTHFHAEGREEDFKRMVARHSDVGIAIDNNCAIEFIDDTYRVITSQDGAKCYRVYKHDGNIVTEQIEQVGEFRPTISIVRR